MTDTSAVCLCGTGGMNLESKARRRSGTFQNVTEATIAGRAPADVKPNSAEDFGDIYWMCGAGSPLFLFAELDLWDV